MLNKRLLFLSGIAILAVVMNHASHTGFVAMFWWTDRYLPVAVPNFDQMGSLAYYGLVAQQKLAVFSVPAFLFITGMFLSYAARGSETHLTWGVVWRRILNLLPPYLIWIFVYYLAEFLIGNRYTPMEYVLGIVTISQSVFFFIPLVIVYYALSPLLAPIAKKRPILLLCIGGLALLIGILTGYFRFFARLNEVSDSIFYSPLSYFVERQFFEYFFYYMLGLVAGFYQTQLKELIGRYRWVLLGVMILSGAAAVAEAEFVYQSSGLMWRSRTLTLPSAIYAISFILAFLAFENIKMPKFVYQLGANILGIYLMHRTVLLIAPKVVYHVLPFVLGIQWIYQPLLIAMAIGVPMLAMMITRKLPIRKYYRYLFG
jgi:fucose 4-O-acetylase-like acetyltransferase